jgi:hypothetical protein
MPPKQWHNGPRFFYSLPFALKTLVARRKYYNKHREIIPIHPVAKLIAQAS